MSSKKHTAETLLRAAHAIERACDRYDGPFRAQRAFAELRDTIERQEKEHIAFGRRLLGRRPKRAQPLNVRVAYFVVRCCLSEDHRITSAFDAYSMRADYRIGCAIREVLGVDALREAVLAAGVSLSELEAIDYTDLAGAA